MALLNVNNITNALIVGPIYGQFEYFYKTLSLSSQYDVIVFNGDLFGAPGKFKNNLDLSAVTRAIMDRKVIYNISGDDYKLAKDNSDIDSWLKGKPNATNLKFKRGTSTLVISGGITEQMKEMKDLHDNLELSFVNNINNKPWHTNYNGRFGYIISNNPLSIEEPKFFNYSAQIGIIYNKNKIYAQEVNEHGLGKTFLL